MASKAARQALVLPCRKLQRMSRMSRKPSVSSAGVPIGHVGSVATDTVSEAQETTGADKTISFASS